MSADTPQWLEVPGGRVGVDPETGELAAIDLAGGGGTTHFVESASAPGGRGPLRLAAPLPHHRAHHLEAGLHGRPEIVRLPGGGMRLLYERLQAPHEARLPIEAEVDLVPSDEGLVLRARVRNRWEQPIPQIAFPQLLGLAAVAGTDGTRLQFGRGAVRPFRLLAMEPDDAWFLERRLFQYWRYGWFPHSMKWLDYGSPTSGLTLYARDTSNGTQGILAERQDRYGERLDLRWLHFPFVAPGETWESAEYVLYLHPGDWYAGAREYKRFTDAHYPYDPPRRILEALGIRSLRLAYQHSPPTHRFADLPELAEELRGLDLAEINVWGWRENFGYPMTHISELGTLDELAEAMRRCKTAGVPVSLFVSHHLLKDGPETDPTWLYLNAAGQRVLGNWTYDPGFLPRFGPTFIATHSSVRGSALSPGWRETGLAEYRRLLDLGATSICFDVYAAPESPNFNPAADGRPDEAGDRLIEFGRAARTLIRAHDPEGSFSGEGVSDATAPVLDYTWEWHNASRLAESAPFRYVFPNYRLNANVNEHPRAAIRAFVEGALLNVMPGDMLARLSDFPDLVALLKRLAVLRRRFLRYFTDGQYRFMEGLSAQGCVARLFTRGDDLLVLLCNPTDAASDASVVVDSVVWGGTAPDGRVLRAYNLDDQVTEELAVGRGAVSHALHLTPDAFCALEIAPA